MSYLSASPNVGYNGLPQLLLSDGSCASQYQMATEATTALSEDALHLYQEKDQTITDQSCMEVIEDTIFSSSLTLMNESHSFHELDHEQLYNVNCIKQSDIPIQDKGESMLVNGTGSSIGDSRPVFLNAGHIIKHNNSRVMLPSQKETNALVKLAKSNKDSVKIRSKSNKPPAEQVNKKDCVNAKIITLGGTVPNMKSPLNTKKSISSINEIRVKSFSSTLNNKEPNISSSVHVMKWEGPEMEPATESSVNAAVTSLSTRNVLNAGGSGKTACSQVQRGRGPALHEALQRIVATPPHPTGTYDLGSGSEDDVIPYFGMSFMSHGAEMGVETSRGARLASRRATLRRLVAQATNSVKLMRHRTADTAYLAHTVKKHAVENITISNSPRLSGDALDLLLTTKGIKDILTPRERKKLRRAPRLVGGGRCASSCGSAALPCSVQCLSHVTTSPEQYLYGACTAVFAGGARCTAPVPLALAMLCQEHAWKRDNYDRLSQEFKPKKSIDRKAKPILGVIDPLKKAKKRRLSPPSVNRVGMQHAFNINKFISTVETHPGLYVTGCEATAKLHRSVDNTFATVKLPSQSLTSLTQSKIPVPAALGLDISSPAPS